MQRVTSGIGNTFGPVEEKTAKEFLPALFEGAGDGAQGREITRLPVKQAGMDIPDPTLTAPENWQASCVITGHLVSALRGQVPFRTADHAAYLWDGRAAVRHQNAATAVASLETIIARALAVVTCRLRRATKNGAWLTVQPSTVNGTELGAQEWRDAAFLRYGLDPPDPPKHCDGGNAKSSICHALDCKRGGLVTARHNELRDGVADLASRAFTHSHVRNDPLIYQGCAVTRTKFHPAGPRDSTTSGTSPPEAT